MAPICFSNLDFYLRMLSYFDMVRLWKAWDALKAQFNINLLKLLDTGEIMETKTISFFIIAKNKLIE